MSKTAKFTLSPDVRIYSIGTELKVRNLDQLPPPTAPSNYKDPLKIQEYIDAKRLTQAKEAQYVPSFGWISRVVILASDGTTVVDTTDNASEVMIDFLNAFVVGGRPGEERVVVGYEIKPTVRLAVFDALSRQQEVLPAVWVDRTVIGSPRYLVDPYELITRSTDRDLLTIERIERELELGIERGPKSDTALEDAVSALEFARRIGLAQ